jgi:hypothetical protein
MNTSNWRDNFYFLGKRSSCLRSMNPNPSVLLIPEGFFAYIPERNGL